MKLYFNFLFSMFLVHCIVAKISKSQITFLVSYLNSFYMQPNRVVGYLCERNDILAFTKTLVMNNFFVSIYDEKVEVPELEPMQRIVYVVDISCKNFLAILEKANQTNKFKFPYKWILLNNSSKTNSVEDVTSRLSNLKILSDSEFNIITTFKNYSTSITRPYKFRVNSNFKSETVFWRSNSFFNGVKQLNGAFIKGNLMETQLKACLVITNNDSLNHLTDRRFVHVDTVAKVNYVLVRHLGEMLNATLQFSVESTWGYKDNNSKWSGMIGRLTRHESDIGATPLFLTSDRVKVIDYMAMTTPTGSKFVFLQPKLSYVTNVFALPFHYTIWISTVLTLVISGTILLGIIYWERRQFSLLVTKPELEVFYLELTAFCQQGISLIPKSWSGKMVIIMILILLMFLYNSYSANIVALLQSSSNSIQTLSDLLRSRLSFGVDDNVYNRFYFPNETEPVRRALYLKKIVPPGQPPRFFPMETGVRRIREGLFAFHMETGAGYKLIAEIFLEHEKCGLQEIEFFQTRNPWLSIQKNSSFKEPIKVALKMLGESGIQQREVSLLYTKKPPCISKGSGFISVGLIDTYFAFAALITGLFLSFSVFIIEIIENRYYWNIKGKALKSQKQKQKQNTKNLKDDNVQQLTKK